MTILEDGGEGVGNGAGRAAAQSVSLASPVPLRSAAYSRFAERTYAARADVAAFVAAHRDAPLTRSALEGRLAFRLEETDAAASILGSADDGYTALCAALRLLRQDVFCLVMERDLADAASVEEVTGTMSDLAEVTIAHALRTIRASMVTRFGWPLAESDGAPLTLGVIGMGKLGGRELNVSSDIDLIFVYEEDGQTAGGTRSPLSNHEFFTRMGRKLMGALAERTAEGYVFRVDMRLRPNGDSGPLVCSLPMLEEYFYVQGREWERYAWIKGRLLPPEGEHPGGNELDRLSHQAAHQRLSTQLDALVKPFVYRRYLDFGVIESIRSLHEQIGQEARRRASLRPELSDDVKLGRGGIREIEFGAQVFQLVRGGQDPTLRVRPTLAVLDQAAERGLIGRDNVRDLALAYDFLRRLEHRLQYADDAQTHAMPVDPALRERLAAAMGFADYVALHAALEQHRAVVEREFNQIFDKSGTGANEGRDADARLQAEDDEQRERRGEEGGGAARSSAPTSPTPPPDPAIAAAIASLWSDALFETASDASGPLEAEQAAQILGYPPDAVRRLHATRTSLRYLQLPSQSRTRFDALVMRVIAAGARLAPTTTAIDTVSAVVAGSTPDTASDETTQRLASGAAFASLSRALDFLERIAGRSAYLALLTEFPAALQRVLAVLGNSQWAANYLISHPQLLDELLDNEAIDAPFDWPAFADGLRARLAASDGVEQQMDQLRHAQHAEVFRILLRDLAGRLTVETVSDRLSELADAVLDVTLETVWRSMRERPMLEGDVPHFAIIAYGKLGGKELGYASDLDLIFLYDDPDNADDAADIYAKLARRMVTWLTTATGAGQLYDVDLRLRPNGSSGLLVTPLEGFRHYQLREGGRANTAWIWEHQALTRARYCAGDARIGAAFEAIRATVLATPREPEALAPEIVSMRERSHEGHPNRSGLFDLKHDRGGMVDIEFIVQYLVLLHAAHHPELVRNAGNISLLNAFATMGILSTQEAQDVGAAYRRYRALQHRLRLDGVSHARVAGEATEREAQTVKALWDRIFVRP